MSRHVPALVVGGGISGLVCAYSLRNSGIDAEIIEASPRPGGVIQSIRRDGFLLELGPQSFSSATVLMDLCHELGLDNQILPAPPRAPRFVLLDGTLRPAPLSPPAFFASSFFGMKTKWSVLRDAFGRSVPPANEESVAAFVRRKLTPELLEKLVGPLVSGIYAGDPERLSLRAAFPQLYDAESKAGSIVRGLALGKQIKQTGKSRRMAFTFRDGNETLVRTLAAQIGTALRANIRVTGIARREDASFEVNLESDGQAETVSTKILVLATPTDVTGKLLAGLDYSFETLLKRVEYAPVGVVSLGYRRSEIRHPLDGFGFLVPRSAGLRVLGTVWNSSLFPSRTPDGNVLMTSFVGGVTDPAAVELSSAELTNLVHSQVAPLLSASGNPAFSNVTVWPRAIPQYNLGHLDRLAAVTKLLQNCPGIWLTGNYLRGPAVGSCVEQSIEVAEEVRVALQS